MKIINDTTMIVVIDGEPTDEPITLGEFFTLNEMTDDADYCTSIIVALATQGRFTDGGGAAPVWSIQVA